MFKFFESLVHPFPPEIPERAPRSVLAFCIHYTRGVFPHLFFMALLTACIAVMEVSLFQFLGQLVDMLNASAPATFWKDNQLALFGYSLIILLALPCAVLLHSSVIHQALLGNYPMRIRWQAHRYLLGQSLEFYQDEFAGRIATKVMQTALSVRETVMKLLDVLLYVTVYFLGMVSVLALADPRLSIPLIAWFAAYIFILGFFIPRLRSISSRQADARSAMTGSVVDTYTNISTVKLFSHSDRESKYAQNAMDDFLQTVHPQMRLVTKLNVGVWSINALLLFSISALSVYLWSLSSVSTGAIAVAIGLALRLNGMSQWIMWEVSSLFENIGSVQDGMNTIAQPKTVQDQRNAEEISVDKGGIQFDDISFEYNEGEPVLSNLTLDIKPGEKIGLVGRSGAGKSTLANLLLRFYDLDKGRILIDEQDISTVQQESLRANIGVVTQDTSLLHRSVRENISYGNPEASEDEIVLAAKQAEADLFIQSLHDAKGRNGYDAQVGERGVKLSGGQRQRIAIARVLLKDAPILILDEATSALDSEVEAAIQESLYKLMQGKTVIAIAHRLSTIAAMDRLIVIDKGRVVEQGNHLELLEHGGIYAQLWKRQSGGFIGE